MHKKHRLNTFLSEFPLYKKFCAVEKFLRTEECYTNPLYLHGETFSYFCENEKEIKTFELEAPDYSLDFWGNMRGDTVPEEVLKENDVLDFTHHFVGKCKSCKNYHVDFLLHIWSDNPIPKDELNTFRQDDKGEYKPVDELNLNRANIYIEKVGVKPEPQITIDKNIQKYFDRETGNWYYKGIRCLSENFGIGSFAYFRRIIEKELIEILKEISELNSSDDKIKKLISEYSATTQIYSIYENIFPLLPKSLQALGDNPFKILYKQTSEGLHSLSEKECLERAENINLILKFVVKTLYEEKSEIQKIRKAIKKLK
ncbi:MAG: hypothetical protein GXO79_02260 [Chlorobi bacterium]|nr:hypothetical protein [Chlorobiota bacterium]